MLPAPSARICTSMCRGSTTAFSRKTVGSPKADSASRAAASMDSRSTAGSSTRRMPRPPPPATALTNTGKPRPSAAATSASTSLDGSDDPSTGTPASRAALTARALLPVSSRMSALGPDEGDPRFFARTREVGVLREEAVTGVDGVGPGLLGRGHDLVDREVRAHGVTGFADLVRLVGLQPVQRVAVFVRKHGDRPAHRVRSRRGTPGSRSPRGWPPEPCGTCPVLPSWIGKSTHVTRFFPLCGSSVPGDGHHADRKVHRSGPGGASRRARGG